jgi:Family of unknown function (DUF5906)/Bifunctional DNA primase/polymerase, N-terminal/Primase C terminal 2 (PriCT-2)
MFVSTLNGAGSQATSGTKLNKNPASREVKSATPAEYAASLGYSVFPLIGRGKEPKAPRIAEWQKRSSSETTEASKIAGAYGINCVGMAVVDVDLKAGAKGGEQKPRTLREGFEALVADVMAVTGEPEAAVNRELNARTVCKQKSPSGGMHLFGSLPRGVRISSAQLTAVTPEQIRDAKPEYRVSLGVDIRAGYVEDDGTVQGAGYIVGCGSQIPDGEYIGVLVPRSELSEWGPIMVRWLQAKSGAKRQAAKAKTKPALAGKKQNTLGTQKQDVEVLRDALDSLVGMASGSEGEWYKVCQCLVNASRSGAITDDDGLELFDDFSKSGGARYGGRDEVEGKWYATLNGQERNDGALTLGSIFEWAKQAGWKDPRKSVVVSNGVAPGGPDAHGATETDDNNEKLNLDDYRLYVTESGSLRVVVVSDRKDFNDRSLRSRVDKESAAAILGQETVYDGIGCDLSKQYGDVITAENGNMLINTFRGFSLVPEKARTKEVLDGVNVILRLLQHIGGNEPGFDKFLFKYLAWIWQNKSKAPKVAIVLRSDEEGTGKGTFSKLCVKLNAPNTFTASNPKHIVGGFTKHLAGIRVLIADEAMFAGDPKIRGQLFSLVTEDTVTIEGKGRDAYAVANTLAIIMTTNSKWAVPAGSTARRFAVADVPDTYVGDAAYWTEVHSALEDPAVIAAFAHVLQSVDLKGWKPWQHVPQTKALMEQKRQSAKRTVVGYFLQALERGKFQDARPTAVGDYIPVSPAQGGGKPDTAKDLWVKGPVDVYPSQLDQIAGAASAYVGYEIATSELKRDMVKLLGGQRGKNNDTRFIRLPALAQATLAFEASAKMTVGGADNESFDFDETAGSGRATNVTKVSFGKPATGALATSVKAVGGKPA